MKVIYSRALKMKSKSKQLFPPVKYRSEVWKFQTSNITIQCTPEHAQIIPELYFIF